MIVMTRRAALLLAPLAAGLAGCQTTRAVATAPGSDMNAADLDFVTYAFNVIQFDRDECGIAEAQSKSPEIKAIAAKLLDDANGFEAKLAPIAAEAGIKPPTVLRTDLRVRAGRLRLAQGRDLDRAFVEDQIFSHEDARNLQDMMMNEQGGNPKLAALAREGFDLVNANLVQLRELQQRMMMAK